ncbi:EndoU domain-containing protein, partial [Zooshikella harenae]
QPKKTSESSVSKISAQSKQKVLYGEQAVKNGRLDNRVKGVHSAKILDHPDFSVETLKTNPDGTIDVKFTKQLPNGNASKLKASTLFPKSWDEDKIFDAAKSVGNTRPIATSVSGKTLHRGTIDGVKMDVMKQGDDVIAAFPCGNKPTLIDEFRNQ